jgi:hypothetical protein
LRFIEEEKRREERSAAVSNRKSGRKKGQVKTKYMDYYHCGGWG